MRRRPALAILAAIAALPAARVDADNEGAPAVPAARVDADNEGAPAAAAAPAAPAEAPAPPPRRGPSTLRRLAAVGAAIVPGVIVHGAGSYVLGERRTARRLLEIEGVGAAGLALGGLAIGGSGGSPYFIWPGVPAAVLGVGLFMPTWLADIWVAAGGERMRGGPIATPPWSIELSTTGLRDPYRTRALPGAAARAELGRIGLGASARVDAQGQSRDGALEARWRICGAAAGAGPIDEGSRLYVRAAARYHRDDDDDVSLATAELEVGLRAELRRIDPLLAGMFAELATGAGVERATYARDTHDLDSILLARFAWGAYLGRRGEATLFYDHRRDDLAGGLYAWRASSFVGSVGAGALVAVAGPWAVRGEIQIGNAWLGTLALRYHGGAR
jgi:hypothetical protein